MGAQVVCPLLNLHSCERFPGTRSTWHCPDRCHVEHQYDKSSTLWALRLWCWKGKGPFPAVWKAAGLRRDGKCRREMGRAATLPAGGRNLFLSITRPNNKHLKGFPWELAFEVNIIGTLAIISFLIKATKEKNSTL